MPARGGYGAWQVDARAGNIALSAAPCQQRTSTRPKVGRWRVTAPSRVFGLWSERALRMRRPCQRPWTFLDMRCKLFTRVTEESRRSRTLKNELLVQKREAHVIVRGSLGANMPPNMPPIREGGSCIGRLIVGLTPELASCRQARGSDLPQGPTGLEAWPHIPVRLTRAPFVSIALIRGRAPGNGSEIALACDTSFASRELAILSQWEVGVVRWTRG